MRTLSYPYLKLFLFPALYLFITLQAAYGQQVFDTLISTHRSVILFDSDSDVVKDSYLDSINSIVFKSQQFDKFQIAVSAHTDDVGSNEYNEKLALKRLNSVEQILRNNNVVSDFIISTAHGENEPRFSDFTEKNRSLNRRVEIDLKTMRKVTKVVTKVIDEGTGEIIEALVNVKSDNVSTFTKGEDRKVMDVIYPLSKRIEIEFQAKNYFFESLILTGKEILGLDTIKIVLSPINEGRKFELDDLNFFGNNCILLSKSYPVLKKLKNFMMLNNKTCIEIAGHINRPNHAPVDTSDSHFDLSVSRACVIYDSLRTKGINKERMYTRGYGNWQMIYPNAENPIHQAKNRRVEIAIVDCKSVPNMVNDIVRHPKLHGYKVINKYYDPMSLELDMNKMHQSYKQRIKEVLEILKNRNEDPEKYTYSELIKIK